MTLTRDLGYYHQLHYGIKEDFGVCLGTVSIMRLVFFNILRRLHGEQGNISILVRISPFIKSNASLSLTLSSSTTAVRQDQVFYCFKFN